MVGSTIRCVQSRSFRLELSRSALLTRVWRRERRTLITRMSPRRAIAPSSRRACGQNLLGTPHRRRHRHRHRLRLRLHRRWPKKSAAAGQKATSGSRWLSSTATVSACSLPTARAAVSRLCTVLLAAAAELELLSCFCPGGSRSAATTQTRCVERCPSTTARASRRSDGRGNTRMARGTPCGLL